MQRFVNKKNAKINVKNVKKLSFLFILPICIDLCVSNYGIFTSVNNIYNHYKVLNPCVLVKFNKGIIDDFRYLIFELIKFSPKKCGAD